MVCLSHKYRGEKIIHKLELRGYCIFSLDFVFSVRDFWKYLLNTKITVSPTLLVPTVLCTSNLEKVPFSCGASPYNPSISHNFSFPLGVRNSGVLLYFFIATLHSWQNVLTLFGLYFSLTVTFKKFRSFVQCYSNKIKIHGKF